MVYRVLDIERDPVAQGFEAHGYDVVVAANVLHATRDLGEALGHCRALLAPSGVLVCLEGLRSQGWLDLTFGLLEGWWRYGDGYRTDGALVGEGVWRRALGEAGYGEVSVVSSGSGATQGVIVARGPSEVVEPEGLWLLASDRGETGRRLAAGLVARNQRVVVAGEDIAWSDRRGAPGGAGGACGAATSRGVAFAGRGAGGRGGVAWSGASDGARWWREDRPRRS